MKSTCRACGRVFGGLSGFDAHRAGEYSHAPPNYGRYCRDDATLRDLGMTRTPQGVWIRAVSRPLPRRSKGLP